MKKRTIWLELDAYPEDYEVGSQPPQGYVAWHDWAEVQGKAGLKQERCPRCGKYRFPQEPCHRDGVCKE